MGGGPIFIPILTWVFDFSLENAIPLSKVMIHFGLTLTVWQIMIFGVAVAQYLINVWQKVHSSAKLFALTCKGSQRRVPPFSRLRCRGLVRARGSAGHYDWRLAEYHIPGVPPCLPPVPD